jgi:amidase
VKDAATILTAIAGKSDRDPRTQDIPFDQVPDYAAVCQSKNLNGIRIGIPRQSIGSIEPGEVRAFDQAIEELRSAGAEIFDDIELLAAKDWESYSALDRMSVTVADLAESLAEYFKGLTTNPNNLRSLQDLVEYTKKAPEEEFPRYDVATFELALDKSHYSSEKYRKLEELRSYIASEGGINGALDREKLDLLVVPTAASTPVSFASLAGSPVIAVPLGFHGPDTPVVKDKKGDLITLAPGIP